MSEQKTKHLDIAKMVVRISTAMTSEEKKAIIDDLSRAWSSECLKVSDLFMVFISESLLLTSGNEEKLLISFDFLNGKSPLVLKFAKAFLAAFSDPAAFELIRENSTTVEFDVYSERIQKARSELDRMLALEL